MTFSPQKQKSLLTGLERSLIRETVRKQTKPPGEKPEEESSSSSSSSGEASDESNESSDVDSDDNERRDDEGDSTGMSDFELEPALADLKAEDVKKEGRKKNRENPLMKILAFKKSAKDKSKRSWDKLAERPDDVVKRNPAVLTSLFLRQHGTDPLVTAIVEASSRRRGDHVLRLFRALFHCRFRAQTLASRVTGKHVVDGLANFFDVTFVQRCVSEPAERERWREKVNACIESPVEWLYVTKQNY